MEAGRKRARLARLALRTPFWWSLQGVKRPPDLTHCIDVRDPNRSQIAWINRSQRFNNPALGDGPATALSDDAVQFASQSLQIGELAVNVREVVARDDVDGLAGTLLLIG